MLKSLLIVVDEGPAGFPTEEAVAELQNLCLTAGIPAGGVETLKVREPNATTYFGKGKVAEIAGRIKENDFKRVILNLDFSGIQQRNLKDSWGVEILDRTSLILQIFSKHAHSAAGKLQVELARENYLLSRMTGRGILLSRLGGGIGTRGPGEMKLEEERRRAREHIKRLEIRISALEEQRQKLRDLRKGRGVPEIALVGYTNAGKSALLNTLCHKKATLVADKLFATLDTTTRRIYFCAEGALASGEGKGRFAVATDTVGFLHNLSHTLVAAFHATLEGISDAQLIIVVLDGSSGLISEHYGTTIDVLNQLSAKNLPRLVVINKLDLLTAEQKERLERKFPEAVFTSSITGEGLPDLKENIAARIWMN
ncbi:MAG: GTPase HflX [Candidatus Omnitrophica bacterium]|nr:GTPase HflX [Candidatus Omnitrophota bacterium]